VLFRSRVDAYLGDIEKAAEELDRDADRAHELLHDEMDAHPDDELTSQDDAERDLAAERSNEVHTREETLS